MAIVKGRSFADAFDGPKNSDEILLDYLMDFCVLVYDRMEEMGIGKKELANKIGVSPSVITRVMSGESNITLKTISKIDEALHLDLKFIPGANPSGEASASYLATTSTSRKETRWPDVKPQAQSEASYMRVGEAR